MLRYLILLSYIQRNVHVDHAPCDDYVAREATGLWERIMVYTGSDNTGKKWVQE